MHGTKLCGLQCVGLTSNWENIVPSVLRLDLLPFLLASIQTVFSPWCTFRSKSNGTNFSSKYKSRYNHAREDEEREGEGEGTYDLPLASLSIMLASGPHLSNFGNEFWEPTDTKTYDA